MQQSHGRSSPLETGRILVTGGAGFIGSALIWALNQRGIENILVTDLLGHGPKFKNLVPLRFNDYCEATDFMARLEKTPALFEDIRAVFHLGACSSTTEQDARYLIHNNYENTKQLAIWALRQGARFVYASSAATYGDGSHGMDDRDPDLHRLRPLNMYGYSKHLFDLHAKQSGMLERIVGLKYFNVFGPNEYHKGDMASVVYKSFSQIRSNGKMQLFRSTHPDYEDGGQKRDFLYVKDAVAMTLHLAETVAADDRTEHPRGGIFNLGSGTANTWNSLARALFRAIGKEPKIEYIEMPAAIRPNYQNYTRAEIHRLKDGAGYTRPIQTLEEAVTDYVQNYLIPGKYLGD